MSAFKNSSWYAPLGWTLICIFLLGAGLWVRAPWLKLPLLLGAVATAGWIVWKEMRKTRVAIEFWCYFLYISGSICCVMAVYPPPEMLHQSTAEESSPLTFLLGLGFGLLSLGGVVHALLFLTGHAGKEDAWKWMLVLAAVVPGTFLFAHLERRGFSHWLLYVPLGLLMSVLLAVAWFLLAVWRLPVNRMARLLTAQRYREAVQLGQSLAAIVTGPAFHFNLATAYELTGDMTKARLVFEQLKSRSDVPAEMIEAIDQRLAKLNETDQRQPC
jgi:hypothetical protein